MLPVPNASRRLLTAQLRDPALRHQLLRREGPRATFSLRYYSRSSVWTVIFPRARYARAQVRGKVRCGIFHARLIFEDDRGCIRIGRQRIFLLEFAEGLFIVSGSAAKRQQSSSKPKADSG